jgi:ATP-dependent Zn protease
MLPRQRAVHDLGKRIHGPAPKRGRLTQVADMPKKDRSRAYHEAGHAVVARALGIAVTYVTIFSTGPGNEGDTQTRSSSWCAPDDDRPAKLVAIGKDLAVVLAGPLAEHRYRPVKRINWNTREPYWWTDDMENAINFAIKSVLLKDGTISTTYTGQVDMNEAQRSEVTRLLGQSWQETKALVEQQWPAIERTANALLSGRPVIDQDELDALIADRPAWTIPPKHIGP